MTTTTSSGWHSNLEERLENWGECLRWRRRQGTTASLEGAYRSPQARHWEWLSSSPRTPSSLNAADAAVVNNAWGSIGDAYHQVILGGWYVNRWGEAHVLRLAREAAGETTRRRSGDFDASLAMAKALIAEQLELPAVTRRDRIVQRVRRVLGLGDTPALDTAILAVA